MFPFHSLRRRLSSYLVITESLVDNYPPKSTHFWQCTLEWCRRQQPFCNTQHGHPIFWYLLDKHWGVLLKSSNLYLHHSSDRAIYYTGLEFGDHCVYWWVSTVWCQSISRHSAHWRFNMFPIILGDWLMSYKIANILWNLKALTSLLTGIQLQSGVAQLQYQVGVFRVRYLLQVW